MPPNNLAICGEMNSYSQLRLRNSQNLAGFDLSEFAIGDKQLEESRKRPLFVVYRLQSRNVFDEHIFRKICPHKPMEFSQKILASVNPAVRPALFREWLTRRAGTEDDGTPSLAGADMRRDILDLQLPDITLDKSRSREILPVGSGRIAVEIHAQLDGKPRLPHPLAGPQLSLVPSRRCRQRRPRRRRLQLPPPDPLAQDFVVPNPHRSHRSASARSSLKLRFFTDDTIGAKPNGRARRSNSAGPCKSLNSS